MCKKFVLVLVFLFSVVATSHAKSGGTTAATFLLIDPGAKSTAMGGSQVGVNEGLDAVYWNPAALGSFQKIEASASYLSYFEGLSLTNFSVAVPANFLGTFGLRFSMMNSGAITKTDARSNTAGTFSAQDMAVAPIWGMKLFENISVGASLKYISQSVEDVAGTGFSLDAGTIYSLMENRLNLGLALQNFGTKIKEGDLPSTILLGTSYKFNPEWILSGQYDYGLNSPAIVRIGTEYLLMKVFPLRAGFKISKDNLNSFNLGVGVIVRKSLSLDYAFGLSSEVSSTHRIGISYRFGEWSLGKRD